MGDGPELPGPSHPGLDLVRDQEDPVIVGYLPQTPEPREGGRNESPFSLYRLDKDRRHVGGVDLSDETLIEKIYMPIDECLLRHSRRAPVDVGKRKSVDLRGERPEAFLEKVELGSH